MQGNRAMNEATDKYEELGGIKGMVRRVMSDRLDDIDLAGLDDPLTAEDVVNDLELPIELLIKLWKSPVEYAREYQELVEKKAIELIKARANFWIE